MAPQALTTRAAAAQATATDPPYDALIDTGALVTGIANIDVARRLLQLGLRGKQGVVFLDRHDRKMLLLRSARTAIPLAQAGVPLRQRFAFYDQARGPLGTARGGVRRRRPRRARSRVPPLPSLLLMVASPPLPWPARAPPHARGRCTRPAWT